NNNFLSIADISKIDKPIVWTLHDVWAFTGGCHYYYNEQKQDSIRYTDSTNKVLRALSYYLYSKKVRTFRNTNVTIVCPSNWLKGELLKSEVFKGKEVKVIPNPLDTDLFKKGDKMQLRKKLKLPTDKKLILFGANKSTLDINKGFDLLQKALINIDSDHELVVFGASSGENISGIKTHYLGKIDEEEKLAEIYSCADVMVVPSRQENLPSTVLEALSCGVPV